MKNNKLFAYDCTGHMCLSTQMLGVSALVPGQRTNYRSDTNEAFRTASPDHENVYEYHSSPTPSINVQTLAAPRRDSGQPSQLILPPPQPQTAYNQFTEGTPLGLSSTQFTRTYYGG